MSIERRPVPQPPPPPVTMDVWVCDGGCGAEAKFEQGVYALPVGWLIIRKAQGDFADARIACPTCAPGVTVTINGKAVALP